MSQFWSLEHEILNESVSLNTLFRMFKNSSIVNFMTEALKPFLILLNRYQTRRLYLERKLQSPNLPKVMAQKHTHTHGDCETYCMFGGCVILSRVRVCVSGWNPMGHCSTGNNNQTKPNQSRRLLKIKVEIHFQLKSISKYFFIKKYEVLIDGAKVVSLSVC